ncbi:hypothetical protein [uncultured Tateyamaria sp.]|uniref:hypothetical protein n=1 Tax=uncultured Tateyamaria sp. TaxID=455651 RepID=UPI0026068204|nr:hypothetical protein [uncultured Tateyamaria sp.]
MVKGPISTHIQISRIREFELDRGLEIPAENPKRMKIMSFKDLTTRAAAILKAKPAKPSKKEPAIKAPDTAAKQDTPGLKKT